MPVCSYVPVCLQVLSAVPFSDRLSIFPPDLFISIALPLRSTSPSAVPFALKAALRAAIAALLPPPPALPLLPWSSPPPLPLLSEVWSLVEQYDMPASLSALVPAPAPQPFTAGWAFTDVSAMPLCPQHFLCSLQVGFRLTVGATLLHGSH